MIRFKFVGDVVSSAYEVGGEWRGQLLFKGEGLVIQQIVPCQRSRTCEADALQDAKNLLASIKGAQSDFEFAGYTFRVAAEQWEDGYRGHMIFIGIPGYNDSVRPLDLLCESYQLKRDDALCEAYAEAVKRISSGMVVRQHGSDRSNVAG